jgi:ABC-2 type transport system permease protein
MSDAGGTFRAALWTEALKARRSRVPWLTAAAFLLAPAMGGLFMLILKDPARARAWGLLGAKAQVAAGVADWPTYWGLLAQATAVGGQLLFSFVAAWVFGREFAEGTAKELLALPTPRASIVAAKLVVVAAWGAALAALVCLGGLAIGAAIGLPGWSVVPPGRAAAEVLATAALTLALTPPIAWLAGVGRGYLAPLGWAILMLFLAQILAATGWGAWFPWSVPALFSGLAGPRGGQLGAHSYLLLAGTSITGSAATVLWWRRADHTR